MRLKWLLSALLLSLALIVSDLYILSHELFWRIRWLDIPMHVFGGITLGVFIAAVVGRRPRLYWLTIGALFVAWEIFEFMANIPQPPDNYMIDTIHDLGNDFIGGAFVYLLAQKTLWRSV